MASGAVNYKVVMSEETFNKIRKYKEDLKEKSIEAGKYLQKKLEGEDLSAVSTYRFIELLLSTKKPRIFAESEVKCDGSDWNRTEFALLGDICVAMDCSAYDNGEWSGSSCTRYAPPLQVTLLFCPGAMLCLGAMTVYNNPDYAEVVRNSAVDQDRYNALIARRMLPLLAYADACSEEGLVVIPGIGCGNFAGAFRGSMEKKLSAAIETLLKKHSFSNIKSVQLGLFESSISAKPQKINGTVYEVRANGLPQLSPPVMYGAQYERCRLFKIVAWDHVSLPGNDFFCSNTRATDDGVSAAATDSMWVLTGLEGAYDRDDAKYLPPEPFEDWEDVAVERALCLVAREDNVVVVAGDGKPIRP